MAVLRVWVHHSFGDKGWYHRVYGTGGRSRCVGRDGTGIPGSGRGVRKDVLASGVVACAGTCAPCCARLLGASDAYTVNSHARRVRIIIPYVKDRER